MTDGNPVADSPADELRAAAKVLRCDHDFRTEPRPRFIRYDSCKHCNRPWEVGDRVSTELAEPLAAWLESVADSHEDLNHAADVVLVPHRSEDWSAESEQLIRSGPYDLEQALAVARVISPPADQSKDGAA